jgi:hypothetical protein
VTAATAAVATVVATVMVAGSATVATEAAVAMVVAGSVTVATVAAGSVTEVTVATAAVTAAPAAAHRPYWIQTGRYWYSFTYIRLHAGRVARCCGDEKQWMCVRAACAAGEAADSVPEQLPRE